jgi:hypothetical protein
MANLVLDDWETLLLTEFNKARKQARDSVKRQLRTARKKRGRYVPKPKSARVMTVRFSIDGRCEDITIQHSTPGEGSGFSNIVR